MYLEREIPVIQNKIFYFVGAKKLEMNTDKMFKNLLSAMKNFISNLKNQKQRIFELSKDDLELFYNKLYRSVENFVKINNKLVLFNFFDSIELQQYFEILITELKLLRKELLNLIEGELVYAAKSITFSHISEN